MIKRKYFLDWLRVLAFAALVLFHVGLLYVTWGYNLKSPRIYPGLEWWMEAVRPWRLSLLFIISGVASRFLITKLGPRRFALNRLTRLGLAIVTAMLLVNPTQVWVQLISQGDTTQGYFQFWLTSYLTSDSSYFKALGRPMPTWDHLWFVVYLLNYTLLFAAVAALLPEHTRRLRPPLWMLFLLPAAWMEITNVIIGMFAPFTQALINDWGAHLKWMGLFTVGVMLADRDDFWMTVRDHRHQLAALTVVLLAIFLAWHYPWLGNEKPVWGTVLFHGIDGAYGWSAILTLVGFAAHWLDKPSHQLSYLNDAVLPIYMLHQPVLLTTAFLLFPLQLPTAIEAALLVVATALGSLTIYHLAIRPWPPMRLLFGLKRSTVETTAPGST